MNAPFNPRVGVRDPFSAFLTDRGSEDAARTVALSFGWPAERIHDGGVRYAIQSLAVSASPSVLLVDLSGSADPIDEINALAEVCEPGTMVIACGDTNDVRLYRDLIAHGLHDYLLKPFSEAQLRDAIAQAQAMAAGARSLEAAAETPHLITAVIGVRGGAGCSTVAGSLAWMMAERGRSTALLDLDVHFGTGALAFDLEPGRGLIDAIENPGRIDGLFIERALVRVNERLAVLSAEAPMSQMLPEDGTAFFQLQDELRASLNCSVIDLPRHVLLQHPALLQDVGVVAIVTELTLAATRDTIRILSWLKANAPATRVLLVGNKVAAGGHEEMTRKDFENSVEHKLDVALPHDLKLAAQAAKLGRPLVDVAKGSKLAPAFTSLADLVLGESDRAAKANPSLIDRLAELRALLPQKAKG